MTAELGDIIAEAMASHEEEAKDDDEEECQVRNAGGRRGQGVEEVESFYVLIHRFSSLTLFKELALGFATMREHCRVMLER